MNDKQIQAVMGKIALADSRLRHAQKCNGRFIAVMGERNDEPEGGSVSLSSEEISITAFGQNFICKPRPVYAGDESWKIEYCFYLNGVAQEKPPVARFYLTPGIDWEEQQKFTGILTQDFEGKSHFLVSTNSYVRKHVLAHVLENVLSCEAFQATAD